MPNPEKGRPKTIPMPIYRHRGFQISAALCLVCFAVLFSVRLHLFDGLVQAENSLDPSQIESLPSRDTWMAVYQNGLRIGYAHKSLRRQNAGFLFEETVFMRITTLGLVQDMRMETRVNLDRNLGVSAFRFQVDSGRFRLAMQGRILDGRLSLETENGGAPHRQQIPVKTPLHLTSSLIDAVRARGLQPGSRYTLSVFDPMTLGQSTVTVTVVATEEVRVDAGRYTAAKLLLNFKGAEQFAWVADNGEVVKEKGLLGIHLEKSSRRDALAAIATEPGQDLARLASLKSNRRIPDPAALSSLQVRLTGLQSNLSALRGGRQHYSNGLLTITKESLQGLPPQLDTGRLTRLEKIFLQPSLYIRSDHRRIRRLAGEIVSPVHNDLPSAARRLVEWVYRNIEKRPVISVPDALTTLEKRQGDCNEHAVLLAALARAAGIPARIETGLVYLEGRFYYHAWNVLYLGRWVTADASFGQMPADATHIRLASGHQNQFELLAAFDKLQIEVIGPAAGKSAHTETSQ